MSPEGGQRFVVDFPAINQCFACGLGYVSQVAFDFRTDGSFAGTTVLGICEAPADGPTPVSLPRCP
jgi:hypothetical protein